MKNFELKSKKALIFSDSDYMVYSKHSNVYVYKNGNLLFHRSLEKSIFFRMLSCFDVFKRVFRLDPRCCTICKEKMFISWNNFVLVYDLSTFELTSRYRLRRGMRNPLYISKIEGVKGFDDCVIFGDYINFQDHESISLRAFSLLTNKWNIVFTFSDIRVKHVHNVLPGPFHDCVYVLTGDTDEESCILKFSNNFSEYQILLKGSQIYRSCFLVENEKGFFYATDSPSLTNKIIFYNYLKGLVQVIGEIKGPVIYATALEGNLFISTSVEQDEKISNWKKWFTRKRADGIVDNYSHVYRIDENLEIKELYQGKKDFLPFMLFGYGSFYLNSDGKFLYLTAKNLAGLNGSTYSCELKNL